MQAFLDQVRNRVAEATGIAHEAILVTWEGVEFDAGGQAPSDWSALAQLSGTILVALKDLAPDFDPGAVVAGLLSRPPIQEPKEDVPQHGVVLVGRARLRALESTRDADSPGFELRLVAEGQLLQREAPAAVLEKVFLGQAPRIGAAHVDAYAELAGSR